MRRGRTAWPGGRSAGAVPPKALRRRPGWIEPGVVRRSGHDQPDRIGEEHDGGRRCTPAPIDGVPQHGPGAPPDPAGRRRASDQDDADRRFEEQEDQDLGPDQELQAHQYPEHDPGGDRAPALSDEEFVEADHHQRRDGDERQVDVGRGEVVEDEGREPVEEPGHECRRHPRDPAAYEGEHGQRGHDRERPSTPR